MKKLLLLFTLSLFSLSLAAQDFAFGQHTDEELSMQRYSKDTNAHAVFLKEFGKTWLASESNGYFLPLVYEYHAKLKIFDNEGYKHATVEIPIYVGNQQHEEDVKDIVAVTYYKDATGQIEKTELDQKQIFRIKQNKYWTLVKFTLPNLRKGCIIEYKYHLETPRVDNFRTWNFQDYIPKIYSEYEAHIPALYNYNVLLRGHYNLTKKIAEVERDCFSTFNGLKCDCSKITYIMADIPSFVPEEYMTAHKNFMSAIYFELNEYVNSNTGAKIKVAQEWSDVDRQFLHYDSFGGQMGKNNAMKERLQGVTAGKTDDLSKAKAIYQLMQKNFKWNGYVGWGSTDGIKKAFESHSGSIGDINLALISALNTAGIKTDAVLLSTRDHGIINKIYPVETDFNYVVARLTIAGTTYMLDASDPLLPFGLLPLNCINDEGRVMSTDKPSYWIDLVASQKKSTTYSFDLTLQADGKLTGTMAIFSQGYAAVDRRRAMKKFNSVDEFIDDFDNKLKRIKILKSDVKNLDSLDKPLSETYDVEITAFNGLKASRLSFNPLIVARLTENPFKLPERTYPVDWGAASDERVFMTLHIPDNYAIETVPENQAIALPLDGGRFLINYTKNDDGLMFSNAVQLSRPLYSASEYPYLKEMFNKIIQAERADVVIKKK